MQGVRRAIRLLRIPIARDLHSETPTPFLQRTNFPNSVVSQSAFGDSEFSAFLSPGSKGSWKRGFLAQIKTYCTLLNEAATKQEEGDPQELDKEEAAQNQAKEDPQELDKEEAAQNQAKEDPLKLENGDAQNQEEGRTQKQEKGVPLKIQRRDPQKQEKGDPQKLYNDIVSSLEKKVTPFPSALQQLIRSCSKSSDVELAMQAAELIRIARTVSGNEPGIHKKETTNMMTAAYIRSGDTEGALKLLSKENPGGFDTSIGSVHLLLKHSKYFKDLPLMHKVLKAMEESKIQASQSTADLLLRQCKQAGEIELMFELARRYVRQGLKLHQLLLDVIIGTAANTGDVKFVHEIQGWREEQDAPHSTVSSVAVAKALLLENKPQEAANLIKDHCPEGEKRDRYLGILVKVWPLQVVASGNVENEDEYLGKLKENVVAMFGSLKDLGLEFDGDVDVDFAKGKGSDSKAQKEVVLKSRSSEEAGDLVVEEQSL